VALGLHPKGSRLSVTWRLGCTQKEADQAPSSVVLRAWGGVVEAPRDAWSTSGQDPILFWVLPCQAQGWPWAMLVSAQAKASPGSL